MSARETTINGRDFLQLSGALRLVVVLALCGLLTLSISAHAQDAGPQDSQNSPTNPAWEYGGFIDFGYLLDFNHPSNRIFRSRGTAWHVDRPHVNMAGAYVKKKPAETSRWGAELMLQGGKDAEVFGFSATAPKLPGYRWLRQVGLADVSYLAPLGKGLTVQGGIFSSLIGYDSLYAVDNLTYTRPWGADYTPYLMMGVNASYPFTKRFTGTLFVINGYWHLANANGVPSTGTQLAFQLTDSWTVKQTTLLGPHQADTSFGFWRVLSDSIAEWKAKRLLFAFEYQFSTERVAIAGRPRAVWMSMQVPFRWTLNHRWSITIRPEVAWDCDGRWTLSRQTVKAATTTLAYQISNRRFNTSLRLEHRFDDSRGPDGGFFRHGDVRPGGAALTPSQHLLAFGLLLKFDSQAQP